MLGPQSKKNSLRAAIIGFGVGLLIASLSIAAEASGDKNGDVNLNIGVSHDVGEKDVGLPVYPGSRPHKDKSDDDPAAHVWISAGMFGVRVAVLKLESADAPGKIVPFYRQALAKYGKVLDCSNAANRNAGTTPDGLDCKDENPQSGEVTLKAGTKHNQHVVAVKPNGKGSIIDLVCVQLQGVGD
ncbi:MAG: hypothetical protein WCA81_00795 [Rhizomicrobium sp.]